jgi:Holliday junction resolvase-like predicted endonuclease
MEPNLVLALLKHTASGSTEINRIVEELPLARSALEERLHGLTARNLLTLTGDTIVVSVDQRFYLALHALRKGLDLEAVCETLDWREFEDLATFALERNGYKATKHFRFKTSRRYEVDVLGLKEPHILVIECKHWKRSWQRAATHKFVDAHRKRAEAFAKYATAAKGRLGLDRWREIKLVPIVITLSETPVKVHSEIPIVPIFYLQNVLTELELLLGWLIELDIE